VLELKIVTVLVGEKYPAAR